MLRQFEMLLQKFSRLKDCIELITINKFKVDIPDFKWNKTDWVLCLVVVSQDFEIRNTEDLTEEWLIEKLRFFR